MVLEFFTGFFTNPFNLVMLVLFVLVGIMIGLVFRPKGKNQVMKILEKDHRYIEFDISRENAFSVECESKKGFPMQRFLKHGAAYTGIIGRFLKRSRTRFLGKEGTAYTWKGKSGEVIIGSLAKALRGLWGDEFYFEVPEARRKELEESKVNVTVELEPGVTPEGYEPASEEDFKQEQDRLAAETWWKGKKIAEKGTWLQWLFIVGSGVAIGWIANTLLGVT